MKFTKLGSSDLTVSRVCLGSMTWGTQNTVNEAHEQINHALDQEINFIDTAEMYPVPPSKDTSGKTEEIIGSWIAKNPSRREDVVIASKIAGAGIPWIRGAAKLSGAAIEKSVDASLKRLNTDYIDLYQLHWVNRPDSHFSNHWPGDVNYKALNVEREREEHLDILRGLDSCVRAGKIRYCGLSNDSPWGIREYLSLAKEHGLPRMVSLQNEFSLIRLGDIPYVIEACVLEDVAYLPWSPLGSGVLSGKYRNGARPQGSRWTIEQRNGFFRDTENTHAAVEGYYKIAQQHNLSLAQMALAWVDQVQGVSSTIIGATSMAQLQENIDAFSITLDEEVMREISLNIKQYPSPF